MRNNSSNLAAILGDKSVTSGALESGLLRKQQPASDAIFGVRIAVNTDALQDEAPEELPESEAIANSTVAAPKGSRRWLVGSCMLITGFVLPFPLLIIMHTKTAQSMIKPLQVAIRQNSAAATTALLPNDLIIAQPIVVDRVAAPTESPESIPSDLAVDAMTETQLLRTVATAAESEARRNKAWNEIERRHITGIGKAADELILDSTSIKLTFARLAGKLSDKRCSTRLVELLTDDSSAVRMIAVRTYAIIGDRSNIELLKMRLGVESDPLVRNALTQSIRSLANPAVKAKRP